MSFQVRRLTDQRPRRILPWKRLLITAVTVAKPLLGWYRSWKVRKDEEEKTSRRRMIAKRIVLIVLAVGIGLLLVAGTVRALVAVKVLTVKSVATVAGTAPPVDANGFTNLLFLGQGDESHDGVDLTDTIMVASIDPKTRSVVLVSFPRDTYLLKTEKMGAGRINSFYRDYKSFLRHRQGMEEKEASLEATREVAREVGRILGLEIHHTVKVDFIAFTQGVDALGGVDITVPEDLIDTEYPDGSYGYETFELRAGLQHLDGATALKYARSRHSTSDFDRAARQQQIVAALAEKAQSMGVIANPSTISDILDIVADHLETTMTLREMIGMAGIADGLDRSRLIAMQLSDRNGLYGSLAEKGGFLYTPPRDLFDGASVLLPVSIPEFPVTWKQVQALGALLFHQRDLYLANPRFAILNAGAPSGQARKLGMELARYGFDVPVVENAPDRQKLDTSSVVARSESDRPAAEFFGNLLKIPLAPLPGSFPAGTGDRITIILGKDYQYTPLQDLIPPRS